MPCPHILQTWEWGQVKAQYSWRPYHLVWDQKTSEALKTSEVSTFTDKVQAAALVLVRTIPIRGFAARLSVAYVPRGPLLDWGNAQLRQRVLSDLRDFARKKGAIFIKIDPDVRLGTGVPGEQEGVDDPLGQEIVGELKNWGWRFSQDQIQYRNTVMVGLSPSEDELLARMKQKARYNVRLAGRKGVTVRVGTDADLEMLFKMYVETSVRDGFVIRGQDYYLTLWRTFLQAGMLEPLIAEVEGEPVAGVVIFRFADKAWYINGMSRAMHRKKMPNYLLQWEAMRRAKAAGCTVYDLWGAPDVFDEGDSMWGVFRFKQGLGGAVVRHIGAWDLPIRPFYYHLYTQTLPRLLDVMRRRRMIRL